MPKYVDALDNEPTVVINGRRGVKRICPQCQAEFAAERWWLRQGKAKFCGPECYHEHQRRISPEENFWQHVQKTESCWLWTGPKRWSGHGFMVCRKLPVNPAAHRFSWELHNGPIPDGLCVLHNCPGGDNPACVNPAHLFLGTQTDNMVDAQQKDRFRKGNKHHGSKLSDEKIPEIFRLYALGESQASIARKLNVTPMTVGRVIRNQSWKHAPRP